MTRRNNYFEFLRGIAILMVIGIHSFPPPYNLSNCDKDIYEWLNVVIRQLIQCPVPIFLAISGFFIGGKTFDNLKSILKFWGKQIPKVYIPVLVWSIPWLLLSIKEHGTSSIMKNILNYFMCGFSVYYFI